MFTVHYSLSTAFAASHTDLEIGASGFPHTKPIVYTDEMIPSDALVEVPLSAVDTYQTTEGWKNHTIVGY